jgi:hypothetical protein
MGSRATDDLQSDVYSSRRGFDAPSEPDASDEDLEDDGALDQSPRLPDSSANFAAALASPSAGDGPEESEPVQRDGEAAPVTDPLADDGPEESEPAQRVAEAAPVTDALADDGPEESEPGQRAGEATSFSSPALKPLIEQRDDSDLMDDDLEELSPNGQHSDPQANIEGPDETNKSPPSSPRVALLSSGGSGGDLGGSSVSPSDEILDNGMRGDEEEDLAPSRSTVEMISPTWSSSQTDRLTAFSSMPNLYADTMKLSKRYQKTVNRASDHVAKTKTAASMLLQHSQSYENSIGTLDKNLKAFNAGVQKFRQSTASKHEDKTKHLGEALSQGLQDGIGAWPSQ